jgi:hypothetical protein
MIKITKEEKRRARSSSLGVCLTSHPKLPIYRMEEGPKMKQSTIS